MSTDEASESDLVITVDDRERECGLAEEVAQLWPRVAVGRLAVGDVQVGPRVLVERKTVGDFVASLADGRLYKQAWALNGASYRPLVIVEGRDGRPFMEVSPESLRGVFLTLMTGYRIPVLRTDAVRETAGVLAHLAQQEVRRRERRRRRGQADPPSKQARVAAGMLGAIPGVGDMRSRALLDEFGSVRAALRADERRLRSVRGVGPVTARALRRVDEDAAENEPPSVRERVPAYRVQCGSSLRVRARPASRAGRREGG